MDKASGVYMTIKDSSFISGGTSSLKIIVPMLTVKGELGINRVTANNFKDVLGYDLKYNSNYLGLQKLLENMSYIDVWRLNQNSKLANAYFATKESDKEFNDDCDSFEEIINVDDKPLVAVANKTTGDWQTTGIKFVPTETVSTEANANANATNPQTITIEDVSQTEKTTFDEQEIQNGCVFYNSSNNSIVGIIKKNRNDEFKVYKVVDGEIVDDEITYATHNVWTDGTKFFSSDTLETTEPAGEVTTTKEIGVVRTATQTVHTDSWALDGVTYNKDIEEFTPSGTRGTGSTICKAYIATAADTGLVEGTLYATDDNGTTYYTVSELGKTFAECTTEQIVDTSVIATFIDSFKNLVYHEYTDEVQLGYYTKISEFWFEVEGFTSNGFSTNSTAVLDQDIITLLDMASDITISFEVYSEITSVTENSVGSAEWADGNLTVILGSPISKDSFWNVHTIPVTIVDWTMVISSFANDKYTIQKQVAFSTNKESDVYWEDVSFGDIQLFLNGNIPSDMESVRSYFNLEGGSNGDSKITAVDIDTSVLDTCGDNILLMNGIIDYKVVNRIANKAMTLKIHSFVDVPPYSSYIDAETWKKKIVQSEYVAIGAKPDQQYDAAGNVMYVYPSVNYGVILANMLANNGSLCYPPAGPSYGIIQVDDLLKTDYDMYKNELKTNRINYQTSNSLGTMMWEQRTTYALNTDLSYIAPVFILDALVEQIVDFERQFNFRYMTRSDLLNQSSGLKNIFDSFVAKGFVYQYDVKMPTYDEAQKAGRTLVIPMKVAIAKDSEVIELELELVNEV